MQLGRAVMSAGQNPNAWLSNLSQVEHSTHQTASGSKLASMDAYISDLESLNNDPEGSWGESEKNALEALKVTLTDQLIMFLENEHEDDQDAYNAKKTVHNVCITHASSGNAESTAASLATTTKNKHEACRQSEKSWNDYRQLSLSETSCAHADTFPSVHGIYSHHETLFEAMELAKSQALTYANLAEVDSKRPCDSDQMDYENKWCAWRDARRYSCEGLESCIEQVDLAGLKNTFLVHSANRRLLWQTIQKLLCRINHLLTTFDVTDTADFDAPDTCDGIEQNVTKFVLTMDVPVHSHCASHGSGPGAGVEPGGSTCHEWIAQEYAWSVATHVVPAECQSVCAVTTTPAPAHEGCETDPPNCAVYNAHPGECGAYDANLGISNTECCACPPPPCGTSPGSSWQLLVGQTLPAFFATDTRQTFIENADNPSSGAYMIVGQIDETSENYFIDGKYTFKLVYETSEDVRGSRHEECGPAWGNCVTLEWEQTSWLSAPEIEGYVPIDVPAQTDCPAGFTFHGLGKSQEIYTVFDGNGDGIYWFNAVGSTTIYHTGIPSFNGVIAEKSRLYVQTAE